MIVPSLHANLKDVAIDWLTLTTKNPDRVAEWAEAFAAVAEMEQRRGFKWQDARFFGYVGQQCGHAMYGKRDDGAIVKLTSSLAHDEGMLFSPDAVHCTRIDLQVTLELARPMPGLLPKAYDAARGHKPLNGRPVRYTLIQDSEGGTTLYVGSRTSMRYGRIYDKGVESGLEEAGKLFRWEMEIKDVLADQAVGMLVGSVDVQRSILGLVGSFFTERGLPVVWTVPPLGEKFIVPRVTQEDAGSLKWLRGPVSRTVARLVETVGAEETLRALLCKWREGNTDADVVAQFISELGS